jgi:hypothetical protein
MPRHPPCTLSSLTTFIDHRHDQRSEKSEARSEKEKIPSPPHRAPTANHSDLPQGSGKRYERPIMGQINTRRASNLLITPIPHQVLPAAGQRRLAPVHTPKRCSTIFRPRQKRPSARGGFKSARAQIQAGRSQSIEACHTPGDPTSRRPLKTFC